MFRFAFLLFLPTFVSAATSPDLIFVIQSQPHPHNAAMAEETRTR